MRKSCIDFLESSFDPDEATVILGSDETLSSKQTQADVIPFDKFFNAITERTLCQHPESGDWCCVPLHQEDRPAFTGEYIIFVDHPLRGELVLLGDPTDADETVPVSLKEFAESGLINQLRFWDPLFFADGVAEARRIAEAVDTETAVDTAGIDPESELEKLREVQQVLEYAQGVSQTVPDVDSTELAALGDRIQSRFDAVRTAYQQTRIERQLEGVEQQLDQGDNRLESGEYEAAKQAYADAEQRINSLREELDIEPDDDSAIAEAKVQVQERLERAEAAINRSVAEDLQRKALTKEPEAKESLAAENYDAARSTLQAARENLTEAKSVVDANTEIAAELEADLERIDDQLVAVNEQQYRTQIQQQLEEAGRWKQHGDGLFESGKFAEASTKYERALKPARAAANLAAEQELLEDEAMEMRDAIAERIEESETERRRKEVRELRAEAEASWAASDSDSGTETTSEDLASAKQLLGEALQIARSTDSINETNLEERLDTVSEEHHQLVVAESEAEVRDQIEAADERLQQATDAEENGDLTVALEHAQQAKQEYEHLQQTLSDHEIGAFGAKLKGRRSRAENRLQSIRTACENRMLTLLDTADDAVEQAEAHRNDGDYEAAEEALREALGYYQTAHKLVSGFDRERVESVQKGFRQTESKIKSIRSISAKLRIQECIQGARECVQSGHLAGDANEVTAREEYSDALYFIDKALEVIDNCDFGTTDAIVNHNKSRLRRNRNRIEDCKRSLAGSIQREDLPTPTDIENVTVHLQPPEHQQQDDNADIETKRTDVDDFGSDILDTIESQFEDLG